MMEVRDGGGGGGGGTSLLPGDILPSEAAGETGAAAGEEAVLAVGGEVGKQELMVTRPGRPRGDVTLVGR